MDCGAETAHASYKTPEERLEAAKKVAFQWNMGKVIHTGSATNIQAAKGNALCSLASLEPRVLPAAGGQTTPFAQGIFRDVHAAAKYGLEFIRAAAARTL